jgi:phospholipase C
MSKLSRRQFLYGSAAALGSLSAGRSLLWAAEAAARPVRLPRPERSGIDHIVVAMMENRSFDHLLGWLPNAGGRQVGLRYTDKQGVAHKTYPLAPDFQGCSHADPDHSYDGARNRLYQHCAVTDRLDDSLTLSSLPTIWDRLDDAGVSGRYYPSNTSFLDLWGLKYSSIQSSYDQFLLDCAAGNLPAVSFVDPPLRGESGGTSADDHPHGDIRAGEAWLYQTYRAVTTGADWKRTVLVINFDEWGGFFDHVVPQEAPDVDSAFSLRGFRVPCLIVSPFSAPGTVVSDTYDHTSILKMIQWRWSLPPLAVRDAAANNLATALDFTYRRRRVLDYRVPAFTSVECG